MILDTRNSGVPVPSDPAEGKEKPPPYSLSSRTNPAPPRHASSGGPLRPSSDPPSPSVNQMHLQSGPNPIQGTFYIDPKIPSLGFNGKGHKSRQKNPPHASFRTRQGTIALELGTAGDLNETSKASVLVASHGGDIRIKLLPTPATKPRIALEVYSRKGDILLFLPKTFCGVVQLSTRKGGLQLLPALAAIMRVVKETDNEALLLLGNQTMSKSNSGDNQALDFCQLNSRTGKLIVGLSGQDRYEPKVGFWKKLGSMFGETS